MTTKKYNLRHGAGQGTIMQDVTDNFFQFKDAPINLKRYTVTVFFVFFFSGVNKV